MRFSPSQKITVRWYVALHNYQYYQLQWTLKEWKSPFWMVAKLYVLTDMKLDINLLSTIVDTVDKQIYSRKTVHFHTVVYLETGMPLQTHSEMLLSSDKARQAITQFSVLPFWAATFLASNTVEPYFPLRMSCSFSYGTISYNYFSICIIT